MAMTAAPGSHMAAVKPCISSSQRTYMSCTAKFGTNSEVGVWRRLKSSSHISATQPFSQSLKSGPAKSVKVFTRAMSGAAENSPLPGLPIDLRGKRAFIAGVADDHGYGWAISKALAAAGAEILVGTWVPALNIFESSLRRGKFDETRKLPDGSLMEITKVYPLDAVFDSPEDVPEDIKTNKRYLGSSNWTVKEVVESVKQDFGSIDILVHSLANGPEVIKPLLETSRYGYLAAISASSGASLSLTYIASERIIPGYGGGMSSAKAALESDTRVLAFEAGRKHNIRVNTISAGPLRSRAAKAIGFIDMMIDYSSENAPLQKELSAEEVGNAAAFLASPLASAITGTVVYVDNGLNAMGVGVDSPVFENLDIPKAAKVFCNNKTMKASVKFREDQKPLMRAKVPLSILGLPFQSGIVAGESKELTLNLGTFFESGPSIKIAYRPNDAWNPFSLVVKTGTGSFGSPISSSMLMSAEFNLLGRGRNPSFMLHFKPQFGDFSIKKSQSSVFEKIVGSQNDSAVVETPVVEAEFSGKKITVLPSENPADGVLTGVFSGMEVAARTSMPVRNRAVVSLRWGVRVPAEVKRSGANPTAGIAFQKIPFLVMNKIGIEHVEGGDSNGKTTKAAAEDKGVTFPGNGEVAEACFRVKHQLEALRTENGLLRKAVEDLRHEIAGTAKSIAESEINGGSRNSSGKVDWRSNGNKKLPEGDVAEELKKALGH
ncbi:hypothetical protein ACFX2C_014212 [Malus domestica]